MTQILIAKPGILSVGDKRKLSKAGFVCLEVEHPEDLRLLTCEEENPWCWCLTFRRIER